MKHGENTVLPGTVVWLAVSEDSISLLELRSMQLIETYMFGQVLTFGGCQDDFMLVIASDSAIIESHKLLFSLSKPKVSSGKCRPTFSSNRCRLLCVTDPRNNPVDR